MALYESYAACEKLHMRTVGTPSRRALTSLSPHIGRACLHVSHYRLTSHLTSSCHTSSCRTSPPVSFTVPRVLLEHNTSLPPALTPTCSTPGRILDLFIDKRKSEADRSHPMHLVLVAPFLKELAHLLVPVADAQWVGKDLHRRRLAHAAIWPRASRDLTCVNKSQAFN